jgi:hypothetical protein
VGQGVVGQRRGDDDLQHDEQHDRHGPLAHQHAEAESGGEPDDQVQLEPQPGARQRTGRRGQRAGRVRAVQEPGRQAGHGEAGRAEGEQNGQPGRDAGQVEPAWTGR